MHTYDYTQVCIYNNTEDHTLYSLQHMQGIVRLLRQSDAQLFAGWGNHDTISEPKMLRKIDALADKAAALLQVRKLTISN